MKKKVNYDEFNKLNKLALYKIFYYLNKKDYKNILEAITKREVYQLRVGDLQLIQLLRLPTPRYVSLNISKSPMTPIY